MPDTLLLGLVVDEIRNLQKIMSGSKRKPKYITDMMMERKEENDKREYSSGEEFEAARARILEATNG